MISIIASTNRDNANTLILATLYKGLLDSLGAENQIIDLTDLPADFIESALYDQSGKDERFNPIRQMMLESDKFVFVVPEYNGSFPGVLKTFIDGLKFPDTFRGKKAAMVGLSSGVQGGGLALSHLTDILNYCGTHVLAAKPKLAKIDAALENGRLVNPLYIQLLQEQATAFVDF